jgi:O-6-methylguanine DNA methyltransferase
MTFKERVYSIVKNIPSGKVASYKQVAELAGSRNAARAVGTIMKNNPNPFYKKGEHVVPCHRVVATSGKIGGYAGGIKVKKLLLQKEGVRIIGDYIEKSCFAKKLNIET